MKCLLAELVVSHNLMNTLPTWGPAYKVSLDIFINSFDGPNLAEGGWWAEILRFTNTTNNCGDPGDCNPGDRILAVYTNKDGYIRLNNQIGDRSGYYIDDINLDEKTWYNLEITQLSENSKVFDVWYK